MSTNPKQSQTHDELEYARIYYAHQYERMAKLEDQRLMITNIVITLSVLVLTIVVSSSQTLELLPNIELHVLVALANLFAIIFIWRTLPYVRVHQDRAKTVLERYAPDLAELDKSRPMPGGSGRWGLGKIQLLIHLILILLAAVSIFLRIVTR